MATTHVSGVAATLLSAYDDLDADEIAEAITCLATTDTISGTPSDTTEKLVRHRTSTAPTHTSAALKPLLSTAHTQTGRATSREAVVRTDQHIEPAQYSPVLGPCVRVRPVLTRERAAVRRDRHRDRVVVLLTEQRAAPAAQTAEPAAALAEPARAAACARELPVLVRRRLHLGRQLGGRTLRLRRAPGLVDRLLLLRALPVALPRRGGIAVGGRRVLPRMPAVAVGTRSPGDASFAITAARPGVVPAPSRAIDVRHPWRQEHRPPHENLVAAPGREARASD